MKIAVKESTSRLKQLVNGLFQCAGGEVRSTSDFPKKRHQVKNPRRLKFVQNEAVKLTESCKNKMLTAEKTFIRSVDTFPEKVVFIGSNQKLADLARFSTDPQNFCIVGVDPTCNVGPCYVTHTSYRHCSSCNYPYKKRIYFLFQSPKQINKA